MGKKKKGAFPIYVHDIKDSDEEGDDDCVPLSGFEGKDTGNNRIDTKNKLGYNSASSSDNLSSAMSSKRRDGGLSRPRSQMGNFTLDDHLEKIWSSLSEDRKSLFALLDSMCFILYKTGRGSGLNGLKRKDIFLKKYVLIPIVCWNHWRLAIFCHFGESVNSEKRTRCILLLDSMEMGARAIEPDLRKFVFDIFTVEGRPESKGDIDQIPILVPKVPQQKNSVDCGWFVLCFIQNFMDAVPEDFSILTVNGYPYFMNPNWFTSNEFEDFCDRLEKESGFHPPGTAVGRFSQRLRNKLAVSQEPSKAVTEVIFIE